MPNYNTHLKIGMTSGIIVSAIVCLLFIKKFPMSGWSLLYIPLVIFFYSNASDLDHHMGRLRKSMFVAIFAMMAVAIIVAAVTNPWLVLVVLGVAGVGGVMILKSRHRGIFHTYTFILLVSVPMLLIHWFLFVLALVSGSSHIFVDKLTSKIKRTLKTKLGLRDTYNMSLFGKEPKKETTVEQHVHYHIHKNENIKDVEWREIE